MGIDPASRVKLKLAIVSPFRPWGHGLPLCDGKVSIPA